MKKKELRSVYLAERKKLSTDKLEEMSQDMANCFFSNFDLKKVKWVHIFLPIALKAELNTKYFIDKFWNDYPEISLVVPKSNIISNTFESFHFTNETLLEDNPWNIPEPVNGVPVSSNKIDLIFLPLLAFDQRGYRVGYGKGFYDKFLATCRPDVLKIGLSCFPPVDIIEDVDTFDIAMDYCIVGNKIIDFRS